MQKIYKLVFILSVLSAYTFNLALAQYCTPTTTYNPSFNSYNFYIDRVRLGDLDNQDLTSPDITSYDDYTQYGSRTMLSRGLSHTLTINAGPTIYFASMYYAAWIDYNNDNDFLDAGEKLGEYKTVIQNEQFNITFTVPSAAVVSTTRIRVRCAYAVSNMNPCTNYSYGEAEDYMVSIADFQKITTSITNISGGEMAFFNYDTDSDYDLFMHDEYRYNAEVDLNFFSNTSGNYTFFDYISSNPDLPDTDVDNLSFTMCDMNNDNALDFFFTYRYSSTSPRTIYFQKSGSLLTQVSTGIPDLMRGGSAAADLNNDGRQDIIICGQKADNIPFTYVYMNTATGFILANDKLKGLYGQILSCDYDNDMDIDIFMSGTDRYGNTNAIIYRNDNNWNFTNIQADLNKVNWLQKSEFGDFNNDGLPDLIIGDKIYRNDGNDTFTQIILELEDWLYDDAHWKDINNDGILEIISQDQWGVAIYKYDGIATFKIDQKLYSDGEKVLIGDYNNDRKQDILVNTTSTYILKNVTSVSNALPSPPTSLSSAVGDSGFFSVVLKWRPGSDDKTPKKGLSYNLRIGTSSGGNNIMSSMTSTSDASLLKPGMGNVFADTSWYLKNLKPGIYYWSVQTIDNSGLASAFSTQQQFTILSPLTQTGFMVQGSINAAAGGADFDGDKDIDLIINDSLLTIQEQLSPASYSYHKIRRRSSVLDVKDLNNDNLPDMIIRHNRYIGVEKYDSLSLLINKGNYQFSVINLDTLKPNSVAAADFDNDGDIDILTNDRGYHFYLNTGILQYSKTLLSIKDSLFWSSLSAIDIDNDKDIDFIISGQNKSYNGVCYTYVYKNNGDLNFSLSQTITPGLGPAKFMITAGAQATVPADLVWNDYNFDGYPDLIITGDDSYNNNNNVIFLNDMTGKLISTTISPRPADKFSTTWFDFNTDGFLDLLMPKIGFSTDNAIYLNNKNTAYTAFPNAIDSLANTLYIKAIDLDNDKDKDVLCTYKVPIGVDSYRAETKIYRNNNNFVNSAPMPPSTISSLIEVFDVILNWNTGMDKLTGDKGLTYNIWVGTANNKADIISPMADLTTGYRYVEALGNAGTNTSWRIKNLPLGTYYWSMQTIDNSMTPSAWAPVKSFTLSALTANFSNDEVCLGSDTHLTDNSVTTHPITSWKWVIGGKTVSTAQNPVFRFSRSGNNSVKLVVESSVAKDSVTKTVFVKPVPEALFTNNTVCAGTSTTFTNTTTTNGLTMSEWHWDFGDNSGSNVQNPGTHGYLVAGTYNTILVAVADNGCSDTIRKAVDIGVIPTAAITLTGLPNFCSDDSVKLVNSYTDTYTYSWQNGGADITGAVTNTYTARQSGSYTVKVTNPVGNCTSVSPVVNITVKDAPLRPAIAYTGDTVFCAGENLLLSAPYDNDLTYKWKLNGGSVGKDTSIHAAEIGGEYTLVVTNSQGCSSFSVNKVEIKVNSRPAAATLSPPSKPQICQGEDVVLGVTSFPAYSYQWLNESTPVTGAVSNTLRVTATGKYQLEISNANGCSIRTNIVDIVVNASPVKPLIDTSNYDKNMCVGEKPLKISIYNPIENYSYTWYKNGAPTGTMTYIEDFLEDGTYYVEADLNGCKSNSEVITLDFKEAMPKPVIDVKGPVVWYLTTNSKAEHYKWYYNGSQISDALSSTYIAGQKLGIYRVSISNDGVCYRISDAVTIPASPGLTGIEDSDPFEGVKIYPNPTTGIFTIEMNNNVFGELVIDIITQNGSKILNIRFDKSTEHFMCQIDLSGQLNGMYLINLAIDKFKAIRKVLVE